MDILNAIETPEPSHLQNLFLFLSHSDAYLQYIESFDCIEKFHFLVHK
jgi:hypothetical protein